jgi:capsular polysaccharide transport system ATP-binding protein
VSNPVRDGCYRLLRFAAFGAQVHASPEAPASGSAELETISVIRFEKVSKVYRTDGHRRTILEQASFSLKPGISYGILGINGAGKSTTMRLIAGTEDPTRGKIHRGVRVSWPLGFAGGFHPRMTGRDNVTFVARIYGEDPRRVLDFVEDFSELVIYLDVPIYTYSSGMGARLAFGMSMAIPFDCYLIDEITSVGDARFSKRCDEVFSQRRKHADIIMVSHSMETIRQWCSQGLVLLNGRAIVYEDVDDAIEVYRRLNA